MFLHFVFTSKTIIEKNYFSALFPTHALLVCVYCFSSYYLIIIYIYNIVSYLFNSFHRTVICRIALSERIGKLVCRPLYYNTYDES